MCYEKNLRFSRYDNHVTKIFFSELLRGVDYMSKSLIDKWRLHACTEFSEFSVGEGEDGECAWKDGSKKRIRKFQRYYKKVIQMIEKLSRKSHLRWYVYQMNHERLRCLLWSIARFGSKKCQKSKYCSKFVLGLASNKRRIRPHCSSVV